MSRHGAEASARRHAVAEEPAPPAPASVELTAEGAAGDGAAAAASLPHNLKVLVADDIAMNRKLLRRVLEQQLGAGWEVSEAATAEEVLRLHLEEGARYDLLVLDEIFARDPGEELMRGSEATRQLRAAEVRTPIIACSGNAAGADSEKKFRVAGADLVWGKPFPNFTDGSMQRDLARLLGGVARATSEGGVSSSSTSS